MARIITIILITILVFFAGTFVFFSFTSQPISKDKANVMFTIEDGESLSNIARDLESKSLIRNHFSFLFYSYKMGLTKKIQAGTFRLSPSLSTPQIITKLSKGGVSDYWLTIIGGTRIEEIASLFPPEASFTSKDFLAKTKIKEGYLFPDSYLIPQYYTVDQTLEIIKNNFDQKFAQAKNGATNTQMTDKQVLILASILEREARTLKVKQGVAGVLLNRLKINMPLQSDVTVQYARDSKNNPTTYWADLSSSEITTTISPFNTYKNTGLPPAPICNPGYDSIYAAFHPSQSDYLFYLTGDDGVMYYAKTLQEHGENIKKYLK